MLELEFPKSCLQLSEVLVNGSVLFVLSGCPTATWTLIDVEIQPISYGLPTLDSTARDYVVVRYNDLQSMITTVQKPKSAKRLVSSLGNGS